MKTTFSLTGGDSYYNQNTRQIIGHICRWFDLHQELANYNALIAECLLDMVFLLEAERPVGKIYGLYSILTAYCNLPLSAPDHNKTTGDVYEEMVSVWISKRGDLSILKLAARPGLVPGLPSWVPAWHQQHPGFIRNIGHSAIIEKSQLFIQSHFHWNYARINEPSHVVTPPNSLRGPGESISVASVLSPGKLRILHARLAGRVSGTVGPDRSQEYEGYDGSIKCLHIHLNWCRLIHDISFHSTAKREEALHEMFRSILRPGIHQLELGASGTREEQYELFRAWFDFMLYLNRRIGSPSSLYSETADTEYSSASAVNFYLDVCRADQAEEAVNILESHYDASGDVQGREGLTKLAHGIKWTQDSLSLVRNHSLCILDNGNLIAVTDFWC